MTMRRWHGEPPVTRPMHRIRLPASVAGGSACGDRDPVRSRVIAIQTQPPATGTTFPRSSHYSATA